MKISISVFETYKIRREIELNGEECSLFRIKTGEYGESTGEREKIESFRGLLHISKGYSGDRVSDATNTHSKGQPMLLCEYNMIGVLRRGMYIDICNKTYKITDINNIQEANIILDLSLEVVINGEREY